MTDLLLSELLVLALLLPPLMRPFSKMLKKVHAAPILPFLSLFVCICIIIGQGFTLSFLILLCFVLIVCISETARGIAFFQGVLNDFYGPASLLLRLALCILFAGAVYGVFLFAPEPHYRPVNELTERSIALADSPDNPVRGIFVQQKNGDERKNALVIVAESFPASERAGAVAALLADKGYSVIDITRLEPLYPYRSIPRLELYLRLLPLFRQNGAGCLAKIRNPRTAAFLTDFVRKTAAAYGQRKRLFLYAEGIFTDWAAQFCTDNPGVFTGAFFRLSEQEPLPNAPDGWMQSCTAAEFAAESDSEKQAGESGAAAEDGGKAASDGEPEQPAFAKPFLFYREPPSALAGFGSLRADDIAAAELLGSGRSIARQDKTAAAAAFDRYALSF